MSTTYTAVSTLLVTIDISKHRHEVLIGVPGKKRHRRLTITNTLDEFRHLAAVLMDYGQPVPVRSQTGPSRVPHPEPCHRH